jgi:competence protein ComFC
MRIVESLVGLYAPHACLGCAAEGSILCIDCAANLPVVSARCYRCHRPTLLGRTCPDCRPDSPLVSVNSATSHDGLAKELVRSLKFARAQAAADVAATQLARQFSYLLPEDALIVPVPTARRRVRARGYDQAERISRALAHQSGLQYAAVLLRLGNSEQKGAGLRQRQAQLHGAYIVRDPAVIAGRRIMLIDDVITTGSTIEEAARVLRAHGAKVVGALTYARALLKDDH